MQTKCEEQHKQACLVQTFLLGVYAAGDPAWYCMQADLLIVTMITCSMFHALQPDMMYGA